MSFDLHKSGNAFGQGCERLREHMGLTQRSLSSLLGVSEHAIQQWERGVHFPKQKHLGRLIILCLQRNAFAHGHEQEEAHELWQLTGQQADFGAFWMQVQLVTAATSHELVVLKRRADQPMDAPMEQEAKRISSHLDWGDAPDIHDFYGREGERALLEQWVLQERCRVVGVLGMGGIGKSALSVTLMHQVAPDFERVVFRSLRDAPPCQDLLADCLQIFWPQPLSSLPDSLEQRMDLLLSCLQSQRCLLVLDNLESLLQEHDAQGRFRVGYENYGALLSRVTATMHQSCLLLTSRESPAELVHQDGLQPSVRILRLSGLEPEACEQLLAKREVTGSTQDYVRLAQAYDGNPLALNIVAQSIVDLFGGQIHSFLEQDTVIFSSIRDLLDEQWSRLSTLEQALLFWLAIVREPRGVARLHELLVLPVSAVQVSEALEALQRRSLVEQRKTEADNVGADGSSLSGGEVITAPLDRPAKRYTLHSVVLEYVTELLVERVSEQIEHGGWEYLVSYALEKATAKEYVRQAQERLLVSQVLLRLLVVYHGQEAVEEQLLRLLNELRTWNQQAQGYGPANLIVLLRLLRGHLRDLDLSQLAIREAYLQGVEMQDTSLMQANLRNVAFTEVFNAIWSVAVSPRGTFWAAGDSRGEVRVWREGGQTLHRTWQAHADTVERALAFSPDERLLATGSWEGAIKLWDVESGGLLWTGWHTNIIENLAFAPNGRWIASCGDDETIRIWDTTSGANVQTIAAHSPMYAVAWSSDSTHLASSRNDGSIQIWELQGAQAATCVQTLSGHTNWVFTLAFAPNGDQLASGSWDGTVRLWDVERGQCLHTLEGHTDRVHSVAWSPDGRTVASTGFEAMIWLWDANQDSYRMELQGHTAPVYSLAFTPDSSRLLSGSEDRTVRVWDVESGYCVRIIQGYAGTLYDVAWSPDGKRLASVGADMLVMLWDVVAETLPRALHGHRWIVTGIGWSPDGQLLASVGWDNTVLLWNAATGACTQILRDPDHSDTQFCSVAWSPDGNLLATGSYGYGMQVWEMTTRSRGWVGLAHPSFVRSLAWSPDGTRLASCGDEGSICLWQASDGTLLLTLHEHIAAVMTIAWSPDGTWLASGGGGRGSGELFLWHTDTGKRVRTFEGQPHAVSAIAWNKLADQLVSGDSDGTLRWWEIQSGKCLAMQKAHQGAVHAIRLSPDGKYLASCSEDGTLKVWNLQSTELVRTLKRDRPYERLNITRMQGLTEAQKVTLFALGAFEEEVSSES